MGRYLNQSDQGERLRQALEIVPSAPQRPTSGTVKQVHRRLVPAQVDQVVEAYMRGATLREVAQKFRIHRTTVSQLLEQRDIQRRYAALTTEQLSEAEELYKAGTSLVTIGDVLKVNQSTVWHALRHKGVPLRRPWERGG